MRIRDNPFYVLGVTPYDTLETINEKYDVKSFTDEGNEQIYDNARQILSSPNKRLTAEVRWFYNLDLDNSVESELEEIERYKDYTVDDFENLNDEDNLQDCHFSSRVNLLFNIEKLPYIPNSFIDLFVEELDTDYMLATEHDTIRELLEDINDCRRQAKVPLCKDFNLIEKEVKGLIEDIKDALNPLFMRNQNEVVKFTNDLMERIIDEDEGYGQVIEYFISTYAVHFQEELDKYKRKIFDEIEYCRENYSEEDELDELCDLVRRFDYIAQPIQLLLKDRGQAELQEQSVDVANEVRDLALYYNNEEERPKLSVKLLNLEMELFSELPKFYSMIEEDKQILSELVEENNHTNKIDYEFDYLEKRIEHDNKASQRNQLYVIPGYKVIKDLLEKFSNYVKNKPYSDNKRYKYELTMLALYYRSLGVNCTWADMWDEALECYNSSLYWANQTNNQELIDRITSGLNDVQRNLLRHKREAEESVYTDKIEYELGLLKKNILHDNKATQRNKFFLQSKYNIIKNLIVDYTSYVIKNPSTDSEHHNYEFAMLAMFYRTLGVNCTWADMWNEALECYKNSLYWANLTNDQDFISSIKDDVNDVQRIILQEKRQAEREAAEMRDLYYEGEWGLVFKERVKISQYGLQYKDKCIPLSEIRRVLWGAVKKSTNGIPTGTDYCIEVCSSNDTIRIYPNESVYSALTERIWKAAAPQIITNILTYLKNGQVTVFGRDFHDDGIHYKEKKWFSQDIDRFYKWYEIGISHGNGTLDFVNSNGDVLASYSYLDTHNVHMLEAIVNMAKRKRLTRLSDLL